jgi:hypothetical protein
MFKTISSESERDAKKLLNVQATHALSHCPPGVGRQEWYGVMLDPHKLIWSSLPEPAALPSNPPFSLTTQQWLMKHIFLASKIWALIHEGEFQKWVQ